MTDKGTPPVVAAYTSNRVFDGSQTPTPEQAIRHRQRLIRLTTDERAEMERVSLEVHAAFEALHEKRQP